MTANEIHAVLEERLVTFTEGMEGIVGQVVEILHAEMRRQAGLVDHTLKDLRRLGHPYRSRALVPRQIRFLGATGYELVEKRFRRGLPKAIQAERAATLGHDLKRVHVQSKTLYDHIYTAIRKPPNRIIGVVGVDPVEVPYLPFVVQGTRYMVPRDFIGRSAVIARPRCFAAMRSGVNALARSMGLQ